MSEEDYAYGSGGSGGDDDDDYYQYDEDDDDDHLDMEESKKDTINTDKILASSQQIFDSISISEFLKELESKISEVQENTGVPWGVAVKFLQHSKFKAKWSVNKACEQINSFSNLAFVELSKDLECLKNNEECLVCFEELNENNKIGLKCQHYACKDCYVSYVIGSINSLGSQVLEKTCIQDGCPFILNNDIYKSLPEQKRQIIGKFFIKDALIQQPQKYLACPNPKCDFILVCKSKNSDILSSQQNVICKECDYAFCNQCVKVAHKPVDCDLFEKWIKLIGGESMEELNDMWLKINTKNCPKCQVSIQKNEGCMHMTCKSCKHEFCWLCTKDWKGHTDFFSCNDYKEDKTSSQATELERQKRNLGKYQFYSERYLQYKKSAESFQKSEKNEILSLVDNFLNNAKISYNLYFLEYALNLIREAKLAITSSYIQGYYLSGKDETLFKFQQADLQKYLETLYSKIKIDQVILDKFLDWDTGSLTEEFHIWVSQIKNLTPNFEEYINKVMKESSDEFEELMLNKVPSLNKQYSNNLYKQNSENYERPPCLICGQQKAEDVRGLCKACIQEQTQLQSQRLRNH